MSRIDNAKAQARGRWLDNGGENSHQPFRQPEGAMAKFRDTPGRPLDSFIKAAVDDPAVRLARAEALMADGLAVDHRGFAAVAL
jgi:hypothetical protein